MSESDRPSELRVVITVPDQEAAVHFYRDVLGLRELAAFEDDRGRSHPHRGTDHDAQGLGQRADRVGRRVQLTVFANEVTEA